MCGGVFKHLTDIFNRLLLGDITVTVYVDSVHTDIKFDDCKYKE